MNITAAMVKELRETSGAGMMDCKTALNECSGNMDEAMEYLRMKGQAKAEKRAGRIAAEGLSLVALKSDTCAAVVEVNSETDFVAKNDDFRNFVADVAKRAADTQAADVEAFLADTWTAGETATIKDVLVEKIATIGENINIRRFEKIEAKAGIVAAYVHGGGKIGVVLEAECDTANAAFKEALNNIAMQIAAMRPLHVSTDEISEAYKAAESKILLAQAMEENAALPEGKQKKPEIIEKMLVGRLNKQLKEICLLEQVYVKAEDGKQTVGQYIAAVEKENGAKLSIVRFVRYETGEGLEKKSEDFAAEVAKQIG